MAWWQTVVKQYKNVGRILILTIIFKPKPMYYFIFTDETMHYSMSPANQNTDEHISPLSDLLIRVSEYQTYTYGELPDTQ